jgi:hypothetical protein
MIDTSDVPMTEPTTPRGFFSKNPFRAVQKRLGRQKSTAKTEEPVSKGYVDDTVIVSGADDIKTDAPVEEPAVKDSSVAVEVAIEAEDNADQPAVEQAELALSETA